jgi:hypothetical protein
MFTGFWRRVFQFFTGKPRAKTWRLWARLLTGKKDTRKREEMKENDAAD